MTTYREFLYGTYVSANKRYVYGAAQQGRSKAARNMLWFLRGWLPPAGANPRILDLGCGAGDLLAALHSAGYTDVHGVDASAEQVAIAARQFPAVEQADVFEYLQREGVGPFDVVTAYDLIEHLTRDEAILFLCLVHRSLSPGGTLILQMPNGDSPYAGAVVWSDLTHETTYTAISLRHLLEASGFSDLTFQERGPTPLSAFGLARTVLWRLLRTGIRAAHYIETGKPSTGVYTRVFACRAVKASAPVATPLPLGSQAAGE
jgi:SAM-dependent methyltransferase